ncbi:PIN domain-containing protein [Metabacillus fastidiosus]|uniref:PIN domain-containing protein n=1 Tax=Metabacillus fastidiosus TaxID=1458 RepID=A0ABU6NYA3_9BACI|nr:PIN domain-containing protein [Metabacillus fastidiosus]MED4401357.1 PIN domain-containing protein [Metabacillus fastidiosus]MED4462994.1 PIN domain-containing protein [Metabacillus fastidiosus]
MREIEKYLFQPKKFQDIIQTALIVIDTNVLLAAYQYRNITFKELLAALEFFHEEQRLLIPSHVLKEFFKNRPDRIVEIIRAVQQARDGLQPVKDVSKIEMKIPSMEYLQSHGKISDIESNLSNAKDNYNKEIKQYREELTGLIDELKSFFIQDPILEKYEKIFKEAYYKPESLESHTELLREFKEREKLNLPPGYKDGKKENNGEGDYIIWRHILEIKERNVIFLTSDNKADWVYKDPNGNVISARRELVEEFYEATGNTFCVVHPSAFLKAYNPKTNSEVLDDLNDKLNEAGITSKRYEFIAASDKGINVSPVNVQDHMNKIIENIIAHPSRRRYRMGDNDYLDNALYRISENKRFFDKAILKADIIANNEYLTNKDRQDQYEKLADWIYDDLFQLDDL